MISDEKPCMDEIQAIALIKQGNLTGLEELVNRYQVQAVYAAYLIVHDRQSAEDIVQTAFIKAVEKIEQFDDRRLFGPWFLRSVVNASIDIAKQQMRWLPLDQETKGNELINTDWLMSDSESLENLIETNEVKAAVRKALNHLSPDERAAVILRHFLGLSESDMTDFFKRPSSTIKWWLHSARKKLKELLKPIWSSSLSEEYEDMRDE